MFYYTYRKAFSFLTIERIQLGIVYDFYPSITVYVYRTWEDENQNVSRKTEFLILAYPILASSGHNSDEM